MDRLREAASGVVLTLGAGIGGAVGFALGLATERGVLGIITAAATVLGAGAGIYVAQVILGASDDGR